MLNPMVQYYGGYAIETILTNCHYPIDANSFVLMYGVMAKIPEGLSPEQADKMAQKITAGIEVGFLQDVEIWKHKTRIDNPLLVEEDGPVYQLRRWYEQFYVDKADVTDEMTQRFEYEIDTTKPSRAGTSKCRRTFGAARNSRRNRPTRPPRRLSRGSEPMTRAGWAKAPDHTDDPQLLARVHEPPPATATTICAAV